jgi:dolichyl-phosphate beta-glucosyltransferase
VERPFLSIVIPAYNEALRLPRTLAQVLEFARTQPFAVEVLLVDNASSDETRAIAEAATGASPFLRVLGESVRGKGAAVRTGALAATGEWVFFADADLSMPIEEILRFLPAHTADADIAIASREAVGAVRYNEPVRRHLMGRAFNYWVRLVAVPGIADTQCGFKCFRAAVARDLFSRLLVLDWTFDVELLLLARRSGYRIVEVPIHWTYQAQSRVHPLRDAWKMALGVLRIRWNALRGKYGSSTVR